MNKILKYIETKTGGNTYKSHRFCFDSEFHLPSLSYDEALEFTLLKDRYGESDDKIKETKNLEAFAKKQQEEEPLFKYFLDGSRRVYKIDDIEYQKRLFPIVGGQIGVACCKRESPSAFGVAKDNSGNPFLEKHLILVLPSDAASEGGTHSNLFFSKIISDINEYPHLKNFGISFSEILTYKSHENGSGKREEYMDRGVAVVQDKMIYYEKMLVEQLAKKNLLNENNYLIKDGSLQYPKTSNKDLNIENAKFRSNFRRVVGVSKSFNPELSKNKRGQSNAANIANLPLYHRTPAAMYQENRTGRGVSFAIWYVRIRENKYSESPFSGVLKMEKILVTDHEIENGLESGEVDLITANIINERNPVCYGKDQRWANHLYPIYLTESFIKSFYLSDLHFLNLF